MRFKFAASLALVLLFSFAGFFTGDSIAAVNGPGPGGRTDTVLTTFETDDFSGSGICTRCHNRLTDEAGNDVSNDAHWRSTMMANAAKDPLWQAKISSEINRHGDLQAVIEEKCSRCHMGMARYQAIVDQTPVGVLETGFLDPAHYLHEAAMDGVSCTICHQVQQDNLGTQQSFTGKYIIDTFTDPPNRVIFGPYQQPLTNPMRNNSGFSPFFGSQVKDSALCGTCHTLYTPTVDATGNVVGEFPEQTTFLEWEYSDVAKTCQDCHLPHAEGSVVISNRPRWLAARPVFGQHHFVGGNVAMVNLLKNNATDLGVTADPVHFENTIARTQSQLQENTVKVISSASVSQNRLTITATVQNLTGHKFPSGFPSRRSWLHLVVKNAEGKTVFESGKPLSDGQIAGNDADTDSSIFEPHHDLVTSSEQVQIYEAVMLNTDDEVTYTLLRADAYAKDNRLLPAGFDKISAPDDIAVHGEAMSDESFMAGQDEVVYQVDISNDTGPFEITVALLFQTLSYPFVNDLAQDDMALVNRFIMQHDETDKMPFLLAFDKITVQ